MEKLLGRIFRIKREEGTGGERNYILGAPKFVLLNKYVNKPRRMKWRGAMKILYSTFV
jgi:hypothetical protein